MLLLLCLLSAYEDSYGNEFNCILSFKFIQSVPLKQVQKLQQTAVGLYLENEIFAVKKEAFEMGMRQQKLKSIFSFSKY